MFSVMVSNGRHINPVLFLYEVTWMKGKLKLILNLFGRSQVGIGFMCVLSFVLSILNVNYVLVPQSTYYNFVESEYYRLILSY